MAKKLQPDIVISDVVMPVMDGLSLCGKLRQDLETCHIPIILLTAQPSTGLNFESFSQGADDYITKPFNISQLEARAATCWRTGSECAGNTAVRLRVPMW